MLSELRQRKINIIYMWNLKHTKKPELRLTENGWWLPEVGLGGRCNKRRELKRYELPGVSHGM